MSLESLPVARFRLGRIVTTPNAQSRLSQEDILRGIQRHQAGDWGDVDAKDRAANDRALIEGSRLLSAYRSSAGVTFWLITEADRQVTTILLPQDYQVTGFPLLSGSRIAQPIASGTLSRETDAPPVLRPKTLQPLRASGRTVESEAVVDPVVPEQRVESTDDLRSGVIQRTLKVEAEGDTWKGGIKPKIRLKGNWLERAGFKPGNRVSVICIAAGVLELRCGATPLTLNETADSRP